MVAYTNDSDKTEQLVRVAKENLGTIYTMVSGCRATKAAEAVTTCWYVQKDDTLGAGRHACQAPKATVTHSLSNTDPVHAHGSQGGAGCSTFTCNILVSKSATACVICSGRHPLQHDQGSQ
jgi:hypothetical protein